jgi:hypothetical protein
MIGPPEKTTDEERLDRLLSELSIIEFENGRLLDDDSLRLIAEVRRRNLLTDDEWTQIKQFLRSIWLGGWAQDAFCSGD